MAESTDKITAEIAHSQDAQSQLEANVDDTSSLPPIDGGKDAWLFLAACWAVEFLVFGFGFSYGVFQNYYSTHAPFSNSNNISVVGVLTTGIIFLGTPFVLQLCRNFPSWARWLSPLGLFGGFLCIIAISFCASIPQLIGIQGILLGISGCFAFCPCCIFIDQWFDKRKGFAYGAMWSAAGLGGVIIPLILDNLLLRLGFATAMRVWAGIYFVLAAPLAYFVRPRLPHGVTEKRPFWNFRSVRSRFFTLNQIANILQGMGYYLPGIYLPTFARVAFGASTWLATLTLMLLNVFATIGLVTMGSLTDRFSSRTCILISAVGSSLAVFLFWGCATSLPLLYIFCITYGFFAGCWPAVWPAVMKETAARGDARGYGFVDTMMVYGLLCVGRGIGNIISGPLSEVLIEGMPWEGQMIGGYGSGFGPLIVFTGVTSLLSGMNTLWGHLL
ncbi:major facilitator superfamily domain-containing protein [Dendryphion nanum]|uniref:Major facilitator superfamily domain-containing protein n=1 Tax=Dendryphion nanum TaxID=256645 RepID=A0A9P9D5P7_9PLEO|nr:major facilitator superfamily domain-containing protein [Dendryphion nanum]